MIPDVDGFPDNVFAVLISYFEVEDISIGLVVVFTLNADCTGYMTAMFFHYFLDICLVCQCRIDCIFLQDRTICTLYSV